MSLTLQSALILQAVSNGYVFGFDIMRITDLPSGTVYPALRRLEGDGLIRSRWEDRTTAHQEGRPARKTFEILPRGARALEACRREQRFIVQALDLLPTKPAHADG